MPPSADLAAAQVWLVPSLVDGAQAPPGFDAFRLRAAAESLARKRERVVARTWPALFEALGRAQFHAEFSKYAAEHGRPSHGDGIGDGHAFAHWLAARRALSDEGFVEMLAFDLRFTLSAEGAKARTHPAFRIGVLPVSRRLVIAARWPGIGERWIRLPWGARIDIPSEPGHPSVVSPPP